jgi:hypothetical protein
MSDDGPGPGDYPRWVRRQCEPVQHGVIETGHRFLAVFKADVVNGLDKGEDDKNDEVDRNERDQGTIILSK